MIRLPLLLRRPRYRLSYGLIWMPYILVYQAINRFPVFEPQVLGMTAFDRLVPFMPGLLPVYVAYIPFFWWTAARSRSDEEATLFFYATHFQLLVAAIVWGLFPVAMPRGDFYAGEVFGWADSFWRWFDAPNNCFPSLHAANGLLFIRFNWRRPWRGMHTAAAAAIIASTLFVKQHYVVDIAAGAVLYFLTSALLGRVAIGSRERGRGAPEQPIVSVVETAWP